MESVEPIHVYLSGPLVGVPGDSPELNVEAAMMMGAKCMDEGFVPFIPHLAWFMNRRHRRDEAEWLNQYCLPWLERCDCVLRFGGPSKGADTELRVAQALGKPLFLSFPEMIAWRENT